MEGVLRIAPGVEVLKGSFTQRRKDAKARPKHLTRLCVFAIFAPLRETFLLNLDDSALAVLSCSTVMSLSLHRYYYYYGPLSDGRDGQAMGCRRALTM